MAPPSGHSPRPPERAPRAAGRARTLRVSAILIGLAPLLVLELALRLFNLFPPPPRSATVAAFSAQFPLFERAGDVYQTLSAREPYFNHQEFAAQKPTNGFRAFVFGGSTVYGHPYAHPTSFARWLELELAARHPGRAVEVINCGGVSYASYRLAPIVHEVLVFQPDLVVLAMGHNDFLEDRTYQSVKARSGWRRWLDERVSSLHSVVAGRQWITSFKSRTAPAPAPASGSRPALLQPEVNTQLDDTRTGYASYRRDAEWRQQVLTQFEDALGAMVADCRAATVPVLIVALGSSWRDCPPFKSEHRAGLTAEAEALWQQAFDTAGALERTNPATAIERYRSAESIDDEFALLHFRLARLLDAMGEPAKARAHYVRAKDEDICPLRMLEPQYRFLLQLAAESKLPLVNARELLEPLSSDRVPGHDLYLDHVHPTIGGHQRIAGAIVAELDRAKILPLAGEWSPAERRAAYGGHLQSLPGSYFPNGRRRVEWLDNWARRNRLADETVPRTGAEFFRQGIRQLDFADEDSAWKFFSQALARDPKTAAQIVAHARELWHQGRPAAGKGLLRRLAATIQDPKLQAALNGIATELDQP